MTLSLDKLNKYARKVHNSTVIGHKIADDYKSAVIVLEKGPKLTVTEAEVEKALKEKPVLESVESAEDRKARLKAEALVKKKEAEDKLAAT